MKQKEIEKSTTRKTDEIVDDRSISIELKTMTPGEIELLNLTALDVLHYSFNYIGVLTGPYFSYRTFRDYWNLPFSIHANCNQATFDKFKFIPLFGGLYFVVSYIWPLSVRKTNRN